MLADIKKTITKSQKSHLVLISLFVIFILFDLPVPRVVSSLVDTTLGNVVVIFGALSLFYCKNNVLAVLGLVVAYELIRRSAGIYGLLNHVPTQENKDKMMNSLNENIKHSTLEEEMVSNILPIVSGSVATPNYEPVLDNLHSATSL
jgi:hypothetical protein